MATLKNLKEAVLEAVTVLDDCDGSRSALTETVDAVRDILSEAYGPDFEDDLEDYEFETSDETDEDATSDEDDLDA
ncbi:MAG: hypothetical protein QM785_12365 [Pyrinomonadaceae bacterium]